MIKVKGKPILKITAEGLRKVDLRLAFVMENIALTWLYLPFIKCFWGTNLFYKYSAAKYGSSEIKNRQYVTNVVYLSVK